MATTCLFLASKVEETPKKLKDVIIETYKVQHKGMMPPDPNSEELWKLKEHILICERELLRVLGFDLQVEHAYRPLLAYIKSISGTRDLAQIAWNFSAWKPTPPPPPHPPFPAPFPPECKPAARTQCTRHSDSPHDTSPPMLAHPCFGA